MVVMMMMMMSWKLMIQSWNHLLATLLKVARLPSNTIIFSA